MNRLGSIHKSGRCDICGKHMNMGGFKETGTNLQYGHCCKTAVEIAASLIESAVKRCGWRHPRPGELV